MFFGFCLLSNKMEQDGTAVVVIISAIKINK